MLGAGRNILSGAGGASGSGVDCCGRVPLAAADQESIRRTHTQSLKPMVTKGLNEKGKPIGTRGWRRGSESKLNEKNFNAFGVKLAMRTASQKGSGKGKSKDQAGNQLCFSWGSGGTSLCADVPPGGECKCKVKRTHKCQICLSPAHRNSECPSR